MDNLNNTMKHLDPADVYRILYPATANTILLENTTYIYQDRPDIQTDILGHKANQR